MIRWMTNLDSIVSPGGKVVSSRKAHLHQAIKCDSYKLFASFTCVSVSASELTSATSTLTSLVISTSSITVELDDKQTDPEFRETLPSLDEVHLRLNQVQVLDVGKCD